MIATCNMKVNGRWIKAGEEYEPEEPKVAEPEKKAEKKPEEKPVEEEPKAEPAAEAPAEKRPARRKKISE